MSRLSVCAPMLALGLLVGCSAPKADAPPADSTAASPSTPSSMSPSDAATSAAGTVMAGRAMLPRMQAHYDSVAAHPAMLKDGAEAGMTRSMVNSLNADLKIAGISADAAYMALADSVLADLDRLPALSGGAYAAAARAHLDRVHRLMATYDRMAPAK